MFVLRTRNSAGAPETVALTSIATGNTAAGESVRPVTVLKCVDEVESPVVRHAVSMQFTGVGSPLAVWADATQAAPPTSATTEITMSHLRMLDLLRDRRPAHGRTEEAGG